MKRFKNILFYAGVNENVTALQRAVALATENNAKLTLMDAVKQVPKALSLITHVAEPKEIQRLVMQDHQEKLERLAKQYGSSLANIETVVMCGDPATEIARRVLTHKHDLVLKSADSPTMGGKLFGSVSRSLLRICPCPLWLVKPEHGIFDKVLAAVDLETNDEAHSNLNQLIIELASSIAIREKAELHVVSGWDLWMESALRWRSNDEEIDALIEEQRQQVRQQLDQLLEHSEYKVPEEHIHLHRGNGAYVVRSVAQHLEADLMVMGTVCRTGAAGLLIGNTAESVLSDATSSILALKPDGFVSPVEKQIESSLQK